MLSSCEHIIVYFYGLNAEIMHIIDESDKQLLRLLQQNNKLTTEELGMSVNLSQSAVQRTVTNLRSEKIIEADISIISPTLLVLESLA